MFPQQRIKTVIGVCILAVLGLVLVLQRLISSRTTHDRPVISSTTSTAPRRDTLFEVDRIAWLNSGIGLPRAASINYHCFDNPALSEIRAKEIVSSPPRQHVQLPDETLRSRTKRQRHPSDVPEEGQKDDILLRTRSGFHAEYRCF